MSSEAKAEAKAQDVSLEWCTKLPKIELHAHLSGSVSEKTILQLLEEEHERLHMSPEQKVAATKNDMDTFKLGDRNLTECFQVFTILHRLLDNLDTIRRVTKEVIRDFHNDGVVYLELRTTPRALPKHGTSKRDYVQAVIESIHEVEKELNHRIVVRLIISVDRTKALSDAEENLAVAKEFFQDGQGYVVGLDFSGNPNVNEFKDFDSVFAAGRAAGLPITVHVAEVPTHQDTRHIIEDFRPQRLGHAVCLEPSVKESLLSKPIPIEICPTSNLKTRSVSQLDLHPFGDFHKSGYPLCICTDDSGVFNINLSFEYFQLAKAFQLTRQQLFTLSRGVANHIFASKQRYDFAAESESESSSTTIGGWLQRCFERSASQLGMITEL